MSVYFEIRYYNTEYLKQAERAGEPLVKDDWQKWSASDRIETGKDAADKVAELKELHGEEYTFTIVRVDTLGGDRNYLMRELGRLQDGTYKQIPGHFPDTMPETFGEYWTPESYERQFAKVSYQQFLMQQSPDHVPHISQNNERKVAFTESMEKGRKDIQKALYTHEYLAKYLSNQFREYGPMDLIIDAMGGLNYKLHLTETVDDMVEIYRECDTSREVGSCMTHRAGDYGCAPHHPVEPYALGGDLSLAYVRAEGDTGTIWGRCLVWPERKLYTRIYSTNAALMRKILKAAGYEREVSTLEGARLGVIRLGGEYSSKIVMPYIDGSQSADWDGEELRIATNGNTNAGNTSGISYLADVGRAECASCCDHYNDEEQGTYIDGLGGYCDYCAENYTFYCEGYHETYDHRHVGMHHVDGYTYCEEYYSDNCFTCDDCGEDFCNSELCYDEPTNQALCTSCHDSLTAEREDTLDTFAAIMTGNRLAPDAPEPQPTPERELDIPDLSGLVAAGDGEDIPAGYVIWKPQHEGHAPKFWTQSSVVALYHSRFLYPDNLAFMTGHWSWNRTDSHSYLVPEAAVYGDQTVLAAA